MNPVDNQFSRRNFLSSASFGLIGLNTLSLGNLLAQASEKQNVARLLRTPKPGKWYESAYRRAVIDMHIPDWDEKFLSEFDADQYVQMLVKSRAQSIVCYAHSHVGLFNYPTKVGQQHRGLKGRNIVQEMIDRCHAHNIAVVLYTSLIHDRWAFDQHPEWHMEKHDGTQYGVGSRYGVVCPNSPYREYVRTWVEEICHAFDFEGMRFDMTFWVGVCYCAHCRKRFADEVGGEMPATVNWVDERWVTLQRKREEWLAEFAAIATGTVRKLKPTATVEHQSSTYPLNWTLGVGALLVQQNDFLQGDFYGDALQGSFVRKLLEDLTPNRPFAYETSFSTELRDHTGRKSEELLEAKASAAIADSAGFVFIDAIDPIGTVNPNAHERMGRIFDRLMPFYPHLGGERVMDIAVYYSLESKFNFKGNGRPVSQADTSDAHTASAMAASRWLIANHLPFGVITKHSLRKLSECKVLILSNVNLMDEEEVAAIREWVRSGGTLYASGGTLLVNKRGQLQTEFMLADVLGVSLVKADWQDREHYIAPTAASQKLFGNWSAKYPPFVKGYGMEVKAHPTAQVLATTTLPWPAPEPTKFSSIHSNPPWQATDRPEVVFHQFGKGRVVYCSSLLETIEGLSDTFIRLIRSLHDDYRYEANAPASVEMTMFYQSKRRQYVLSLINFQKELPNIPIEGIKVRLRLGDERIWSIAQLPSNKAIKHQEKQGVTTFLISRLETLAVFAIHVE